jgi:hypothetical protein
MGCECLVRGLVLNINVVALLRGMTDIAHDNGCLVADKDEGGENLQGAQSSSRMERTYFTDFPPLMMVTNSASMELVHMMTIHLERYSTAPPIK